MRFVPVIVTTALSTFIAASAWAAPDRPVQDAPVELPAMVVTPKTPAQIWGEVIARELIATQDWQLPKLPDPSADAVQKVSSPQDLNRPHPQRTC